MRWIYARTSGGLQPQSEAGKTQKRQGHGARVLSENLRALTDFQVSPDGFLTRP